MLLLSTDFFFSSNFIRTSARLGIPISNVPHQFARITALLICLFLGPWLIARLKEFQIGQYIRQEGPSSHQSKAGTPTMGGVLINIAISVPTLLWADLGQCSGVACRHRNILIRYRGVPR